MADLLAYSLLILIDTGNASCRNDMETVPMETQNMGVKNETETRGIPLDIGGGNS